MTAMIAGDGLAVGAAVKDRAALRPPPAVQGRPATRTWSARSWPQTAPGRPGTVAVTSAGPVGKAGLRPGDVITSAGNTRTPDDTALPEAPQPRISTRPPQRTHPRCIPAGYMRIKEDDMTSTLTPTCSFCGLAFANRPMLELHIREDHLQRGHAAEPGQDDPASPRTRRMRAGGPAREHGKPATPSRATKEVSTMNGTQPRHPIAGWPGNRRTPGDRRPPARQRATDARIGNHAPAGLRTPPPAPGRRARRPGHSHGE